MLTTTILSKWQLPVIATVPAGPSWSSSTNSKPARTIGRLLPVLFLCSLALGQMPNPVQVANSSGAFQNNVTTGNLIFMGAHSEGALTTPTTTGTATLSAFTLIDSHTGGANAYLWCATVSSGGTLTTNLAGSISFGGQTTMEFPATAGYSCTKDASANGATVSGTVTTSNITTTSNGDLMICYMSNFHSAAQVIPHLGSGWLATLSQTGSDSGGGAYKFAGTNGSYNCVFDGGSDTNAGYVIAAFAPSAATMITTALPTGALTNAYSYTALCVGGAGAYTWSASNLPTGLSINSSTGVISGTPTGGTKTPTITCTDGTHSASLTTAPLTVNSSAGTISLTGSGAVTTTSSAISLGTVSAGSCIVVSTFQQPGAAIVQPTDSLGTNLKYVGLQNVSPTALSFEGLFVGQATSTGSDTVTVSSGGAQGVGSAAAAAFSNCQAFTDVAGSNSGQNAGSATISAPAVTTVSPNSEIWSSIIGFTNGTTYTAGTGFTLAASQTAGFPIAGEYANESATGSYTPTFSQTGNTNGNWAAWTIALRPSTSGTVGVSFSRGYVF